MTHIGYGYTSPLDSIRSDIFTIGNNEAYFLTSDKKYLFKFKLTSDYMKKIEKGLIMHVTLTETNNGKNLDSKHLKPKIEWTGKTNENKGTKMQTIFTKTDYGGKLDVIPLKSTRVVK